MLNKIYHHYIIILLLLFISSPIPVSRIENIKVNSKKVTVLTYVCDFVILIMSCKSSAPLL